MVAASELYNNLSQIYFWIFDVIFVIDVVGDSRMGYGTDLKTATTLIIDMMEEEEKKLRGWINPPYVRIGTLKEALDIVTKVQYFLENILLWNDVPYVRRGLDQLIKGEEIMRKVMEEEVRKIKNNWSKERKEKENMIKKKEFERINNNWIKVQEKFRALGHPDWMPYEEEKKKKKGMIEKIRGWLKKWRK